MKKTTQTIMHKVTLPGVYKRIASMIFDKTARRAYILAMIDAENTYQAMRRRQPKEKDAD